MLKDIHGQGLRLCDHKTDNILFDPVTSSFYLTDLEGVRNVTADC
jgi:hypothetical protein